MERNVKISEYASKNQEYLCWPSKDELTRYVKDKLMMDLLFNTDNSVIHNTNYVEPISLVSGTMTRDKLVNHDSFKITPLSI